MRVKNSNGRSAENVACAVDENSDGKPAKRLEKKSPDVTRGFRVPPAENEDIGRIDDHARGNGEYDDRNDINDLDRLYVSTHELLYLYYLDNFSKQNRAVPPCFVQI